MHPDHTTNDVPYGYCHCGCGQKTTICVADRPERDEIKGSPHKYLRGHHRRAPLEVRFWRHVELAADDQCWLWRAHKNPKGYGITNDGKQLILAHRVSWQIHNGPIPSYLFVLHTCDVRNCVNPNHLFLGSQAENVKDMDTKGRRGKGGGTKALGELAPTSKLKSSDIPIIRSLHAEGIACAQIAKRYNVSRQSILAIVHGETWKHVP